MYVVRFIHTIPKFKEILASLFLGSSEKVEKHLQNACKKRVANCNEKIICRKKVSFGRKVEV